MQQNTNYTTYITLHNQSLQSSTKSFSDGIYFFEKLAGNFCGQHLYDKLGDFAPQFKDIEASMDTIHVDNTILGKYLDHNNRVIKEFEKEVDWEFACNELTEHIEKNKELIILQEKLNDILEKKIKEIENKIIINSEENDIIKNIESTVKKLHDDGVIKNITQKSDVYHLYSDGEISRQKGGNIYGMRIESTVCPSIIVPQFKFPLKYGQQTYAIISHEDAVNIREQMSQVSISENTVTN